MNASDEDAQNYIKIFTLLTQSEIEAIIAQHLEAPHSRVLQKALAEDITTRVHGVDALEIAIKASNILFGKSTSEDLKGLSERDFFAVFDGVPQATVTKNDFEEGLDMIGALAAGAAFTIAKLIEGGHA